jgi:hypothetical protein
VSFDIRLKLSLERKWDEGFVVPSTRNWQLLNTFLIAWPSIAFNYSKT